MIRIRKEQNDSGWSELYPLNPVHPVKNVFWGCGFAALGCLWSIHFSLPLAAL
jgi:hypothetical protein